MVAAVWELPLLLGWVRRRFAVASPLDPVDPPDVERPGARFALERAVVRARFDPLREELLPLRAEPLPAPLRDELLPLRDDPLLSLLRDDPLREELRFVDAARPRLSPRLDDPRSVETDMFTSLWWTYPASLMGRDAGVCGRVTRSGPARRVSTNIRCDCANPCARLGRAAQRRRRGTPGLSER